MLAVLVSAALPAGESRDIWVHRGNFGDGVGVDRGLPARHDNLPCLKLADEQSMSRKSACKNHVVAFDEGVPPKKRAFYQKKSIWNQLFWHQLRNHGLCTTTCH